MLYSGYNETKLIDRVERYNVVFLDVFDTVLKRDVIRPTDVFPFVGRRIVEEYGIDTSDFQKIRMEIEKTLKFASLTEIYKELVEKYPLYNKVSVNWLCENEMRIELELSCINSKVFSLLEFCKNQGKRVFLVSDMYMSSTQIAELLKKNGVYQSEHYEKLYVSNEYRATKKDGELFKLILEELKLNPKEVIHIGDAWRSDYISPMLKHIKGVHIPKEDLNIKGNQISNRYECIINNRINLYKDQYYRFGYEYFGILLLGMTNWVKANNKENNQLIFLAREGQLIEKAYKQIYPDSNTVYLYVSRRSLIIPTLWMKKSVEERLRALPLSRDFTLKTVLQLLGIEDVFVIEKLLENKYFKNVEDLISDESLFEKFLKYDSSIIEYSKQQYILFKDMLVEKNIDLQNDLHIVDVGWKGSMQKALQTLLNSFGYNKNIYGYYLGVSKEGKRKNPEIFGHMNGYLFYGNEQGNYIEENLLFSFCGLLESMFTANHGSVIGYKKEMNSIVPILEDYEFDDFTKSKLDNIQEGAMQSLSDFAIYDELKNEAVLPKEAFSKIGFFANYPTKEGIKMFEDFLFFDVTKTKMCGNGNWTAFDLKGIRNDFYNCGWRVGFLKKFFPMLPASKIYSFLRR